MVTQYHVINLDITLFAPAQLPAMQAVIISFSVLLPSLELQSQCSYLI